MAAFSGSAGVGEALELYYLCRFLPSADFGVVAGVQLYDVGVATVLRLGDVGVLAAIHRHETEASGDQLAQVPHSAHAGDRDGYARGEDRAAEQRKPADHVSQR